MGDIWNIAWFHIGNGKYSGESFHQIMFLIIMKVVEILLSGIKNIYSLMGQVCRRREGFKIHEKSS